MRRWRRWLTFVVVLVLGLGAAVLGCVSRYGADFPGRRSGVVVDGPARFEVLSSTLIRLEYAGNGRFEDRPTYNAVNRSMPVPSYSTSVEDGQRVIRTSKLTVRYRRGSGHFTPSNVTSSSPPAPHR